MINHIKNLEKDLQNWSGLLMLSGNLMKEMNKLKKATMQLSLLNNLLLLPIMVQFFLKIIFPPFSKKNSGNYLVVSTLNKNNEYHMLLSKSIISSDLEYIELNMFVTLTN